MFDIDNFKTKDEKKKAKYVTVNGKKIAVSTTATQLTHLSSQSTSKMSRNVQELNRKVLQFINNQ